MSKLRIGALIAAAALTLSFAGMALAADSYATVDGHAPFSADANHADYWETDGLTCEKVYDGEGSEIFTWPADKDYAKVIVKAGADNVGDNANTIFIDVAQGELVFADTNGNNTADPGGKDGDKAISHVIVCVAAATTTTTTTDQTTTTSDTETTDTTTTDTTTTTTATTPTTTTTTVDTETTGTATSTTKATTPQGSVEELTPPHTDVLAQPTSTSSVPTGVLLVLAGLLAAVMVVIPAAARRR